MNSLAKSKMITACVLGIVGVAMMSLAPAMAATAVRDHRTKPIVRDHRANKPEVRDHRDASSSTRSGGVTVKDSQ